MLDKSQPVVSLESALALCRQGESVDFDRDVSIDLGTLTVRGEAFSLNSLRPLTLTGLGAVEIRPFGAAQPVLVLEPGEVDHPLLLVDLVNTLIDEIPYLERRSVTGWPPGSVGDLSARLGYDWRDLKMGGYSDERIQGVLDGRYTLEELLRLRPRRRRR